MIWYRSRSWGWICSGPRIWSSLRFWGTPILWKRPMFVQWGRGWIPPWPRISGKTGCFHFPQSMSPVSKVQRCQFGFEDLLWVSMRRCLGCLASKLGGLWQFKKNIFKTSDCKIRMVVNHYVSIKFLQIFSSRSIPKVLFFSKFSQFFLIFDQYSLKLKPVSSETLSNFVIYLVLYWISVEIPVQQRCMKSAVQNWAN